LSRSRAENRFGRELGVPPIVIDAKQLRLEAWDRTPPGQPAQIELNRHGVAMHEIAWKATTDSGVVSVSATHLPFGDGEFQQLVLADLLEYVRDERSVLSEVARVLVPEGRLMVLVPYHGPTTWLDGANWHRYLHDLGGSDSMLPELAETGWRRRYRRSDLEALLEESGFTLGTVRQRGTGLSELGWFIGRLLQEKRPPVSMSAELDLIRIRYAARSFDRRMPMGSLGSWLIVEAGKNDPNASSEDRPGSNR
jgi:SAM-dependent methyltransferase